MQYLELNQRFVKSEEYVADELIMSEVQGKRPDWSKILTGLPNGTVNRMPSAAIVARNTSVRLPSDDPQSTEFASIPSS